MRPSTVSRLVDHMTVDWVRRHPVAFPVRRHCAIEDLIGGVARGLVDAQLALDSRADERMKAWEEDGIPPSGTVLGGCRVSLTVSSTVSPRRGLSGPTRILVAPRRAGSSRIVFGFRRGPRRRGPP